MGSGIRRDCLFVVVGAAVGWVGHSILASREPAGPEAATPTLAVNSTRQPASHPQDALRPGAASDRPSGATDSLSPASAGAMADSDAVSDKADASTMILSPLHSGDSAESETQNESDAGNLAEKARDDLKHAMMIRCEFKPGATGYWANKNLSVSLFEWQGGPITFQVVDLNAGTARILGGVGATGSQEGTIDAMVAATGTGLHFSTFTPTRVLVVSTVFANLDRSGRYRAVMSRHGSPTFYDNISEQNYGSCDIGLSQLGTRRE
jgi:hypothetical protein